MKVLKSLLLGFAFAIACFSCSNKEKKQPADTPGIQIDSVNTAKRKKMNNPYSPVDFSPMDMSYYPADYPIQKMTNTLPPPLARVIYSRPHLEGRRLFQNLLKYGEPWRLGANEATELDLYRDAIIQNKKIKAGRYVLYCIPQADKWQVIFNSNIDSWGLVPDPKKDIAKFDIPVHTTNQHIEYFTMVFEKKDSTAQLLMSWDDVEARLPIQF